MMRFWMARPSWKSEGMMNRKWSFKRCPSIPTPERLNGSSQWPPCLPNGARCGPLFKIRQRISARIENPKQTVQFRDHENFHDLGTDIGQPKLSVLLLDAVVDVDEHAQG